MDTPHTHHISYRAQSSTDVFKVPRAGRFERDPTDLFQQIWNDGCDEEPKVRFPPYCVWAGQVVLGFNAPSDRQFADPE
jgi:hypothetical protein